LELKPGNDYGALSCNVYSVWRIEKIKSWLFDRCTEYNICWV